ncbi:MAG: phosphatidate cytidylyltransferase [Bacteroidia bacterium]
MLVRALSGVVFVCVVIGAIFWGGPSYVFLLAIVSGIALHEYMSNVQKTGKADFHGLQKVLPLVAGFSVLLYGNALFYAPNKSVLLVIPLMLMLAFARLVFTKMVNGINTIAYTFMGLGWVTFNFILLIYWAYIYGEYSYTYLIGGIIFIWVNDSFAYLTGRFIGKRKLYERVSPNKTWEGTIGGLLFAVLAGFLFAYFGEFDSLVWMGFGLICGLCATVGDLFESVIKRSLGVKDMGKIMPGHGGMLDRFDALIFAAPFGAAYIHLVMI